MVLLLFADFKTHDSIRNLFRTDNNLLLYIFILISPFVQCDRLEYEPPPQKNRKKQKTKKQTNNKKNKCINTKFYLLTRDVYL